MAWLVMINDVLRLFLAHSFCFLLFAFEGAHSTKWIFMESKKNEMKWNVLSGEGEVNFILPNGNGCEDDSLYHFSTQTSDWKTIQLAY